MSSPTTPADARTGLDWIRRANDRAIGSSEFRDVSLEIAEGGSVLRTLRVSTVRQTDGNRSRTLFCLIGPEGLRNINYVLTERRGDPDALAVSLHLPYAGGTFTDLPVAQQRQGVLGSTFSYEDLRTWQYEHGQTFGEPRIDGAVVRIRSEHPERTCEILLDPEDAFVVGVDHLSPGPERRYRATDITNVDGVRIAGVMAMHQGDRCTTLRLHRAWSGRDLDPRLFQPDLRRNCWQQLREL